MCLCLWNHDVIRRLNILLCNKIWTIILIDDGSNSLWNGRQSFPIRTEAILNQVSSMVRKYHKKTITRQKKQRNPIHPQTEPSTTPEHSNARRRQRILPAKQPNKTITRVLVQAATAKKARRSNPLTAWVAPAYGPHGRSSDEQASSLTAHALFIFNLKFNSIRSPGPMHRQKTWPPPSRTADGSPGPVWANRPYVCRGYGAVSPASLGPYRAMLTSGEAADHLPSWASPATHPRLALSRRVSFPPATCFFLILFPVLFPGFFFFFVYPSFFLFFVYSFSLFSVLRLFFFLF